MEQKSQCDTQTVRVILFIVLILSTICFYATSYKYFFFGTLQVLSAVFAVVFAVDSVTGLVRMRQTTSRDWEAITGVSINIMSFTLLALFTFASVIGYIPARHLPWILPVGLIALPFVLAMGHGPLLERETTAIIQFFLGALLAGGLTWGQLALVEHFDTWLFLMIGFIPVPLLGITVLLTGLASVFCVLVTACAIVFHALRFAYSVK